MTARDGRSPSIGKAALVIGVGNRYRSDDAAGLLAAELVREGSDRATVVEFEGDLTSLVDVWDGSTEVYVLDALASGAAPGSVARLDASEDRVPAPFHGRGTHTLSMAEVVELAKAVHRLPSRLVAYGIEGASFAAGVGVSPEVAAGARDAAARVVAELEEAAG